MRQVIGTLLFVAALLAGFATLAGCNGTTTTTTDGVRNSLATVAPTTSASGSSTSEASSTSAAPGSTPTTSGGAVSFAELVNRYSSLLEVVEAPGILPYTLLPSEEVGSVFKTQSPSYEPDVQGYRLANGDTVILFGASSAPPSMTRLTEAFTSAYGGEGRELFAHFYTSSGYLVASKDYAYKLGVMGLAASEAPSLQDAVMVVQAPGFGEKHYK